MSTPWPLVWSIQPTSYNWNGVVGNPINFSVYAYPDPDFPQRWEDENTTTDPSGNPVTPPLPDQPTDITYQFDTTNIDSDEHYDLDEFDGLSVIVDDSSIFLPFKSIKFSKDDQDMEVQYIEDLNSIGYDYVYSFVPSPKEAEVKYITIIALSTSDSDLSGRFEFRVENDFDAVRSSLNGVSEQSRQYLAAQQDGDGTPPSGIGDKEANESSEEELPISSNYKEFNDRSELFGVTDDNKNVDQMFKDGEDERAIESIDDGSSITNYTKAQNVVKEETDNRTIDEKIRDGENVDGWFDNLS